MSDDQLSFLVIIIIESLALEFIVTIPKMRTNGIWQRPPGYAHVRESVCVCVPVNVKMTE